MSTIIICPQPKKYETNWDYLTRILHSAIIEDNVLGLKVEYLKS